MPTPRATYDIKTVEALAACCCTLDEMAAYLNLSQRTVDRLMARKSSDFCLAVMRGKNYGAATLRRKQFELALKGDRTMLIWLGKNLLGQKDSPLVEVHAEASANNFVLNDAAKKKLTEMAYMIRREAFLARAQVDPPNASPDLPESNGTN